MIHSFLKYLKKKSIDYVITNGYEDLFSEFSTENDVDILFKKQDFLSIEKTLKSFCKINGFKIVQNYHQEVYAKNIFLYNPENQKMLNLDIYGLFHRKHVVLFSEEEIFNNKTTYRDINILAIHQEFIHYFLKKITKGDLKENVFLYLKMLLLKDETKCTETLNTYLLNDSKKVKDAFLNDNLELINNEKETILLNLKKGNPTISYWFKDKVRIIKRVLFPTGISIAFLGPDGSGKTTIINGLVNSNLPFRQTNYFHLKPIENTEKKITVTTDPHKYKPYSKLKSLVKLCYFFFQYNLGWLKSIVPLRVRSSLVIFDRYYDDLIADNKRYRYGGGIFLAKFFRLFIKKPALYFILVTDAATIYKRKQEVTFSELENQVKKYKDFADTKRYFEIDVSKTPDLIIKDVYSILMKKMYERY